MQPTHLSTFWHKFRIYPIRKTKVTSDQISLIERNYFTFRRMTDLFGLIRYKADDFSENSYSNVQRDMCSDDIVGVTDNVEQS